MGELRPATEFPWDKWLMKGAYGIWDLCDAEYEDNEGILPPIGYKEGEAL